MGVVVTFDPVAFAVRYPELAYIPAATLVLYAAEATLYIRNDGGGAVSDATVQATLLNMVTAHIAALNAPAQNGQPSPTLVGRISSASEGSVSVSVENSYPPGTPQWYQQTKYGAAFWAATAPYRTMRYRAAPRPPSPPGTGLMIGTGWFPGSRWGC